MKYEKYSRLIYDVYKNGHTITPHIFYSVKEAEKWLHNLELHHKMCGDTTFKREDYKIVKILTITEIEKVA